MPDQDLERIEKLILAEWISPLRELDSVIEQKKDDGIIFTITKIINSKENGPQWVDLR